MLHNQIEPLVEKARKTDRVRPVPFRDGDSGDEARN
jgi:hypothetical protein